jgi:hypothetical protein
MIILTFYEIGTKIDGSPWIWNDVAWSLLQEIRPLLDPDESKRITACFTISDFLHSLAKTKTTFMVSDTQSSSCPQLEVLAAEEEVPESLKEYPKYPVEKSTQQTAPDQYEIAILMDLIRLNKKIWDFKVTLTELHRELVTWWESLDETFRMVSPLMYLVGGGYALFQEPKWLYSRNKPSSIKVLVNLLFFTTLAQAHTLKVPTGDSVFTIATTTDQIIDVGCTKKDKFYSVSETLGKEISVSTSEILLACYRAQNRILKRVRVDSKLILGLPILPALLFPSILGILQDSSMAPAILLGTSTELLLYGADVNPHGIEPISSYIHPSLETQGKVWNSVSKQSGNLIDYCDGLRKQLLINPISVFGLATRGSDPDGGSYCDKTTKEAEFDYLLNFV